MKKTRKMMQNTKYRAQLTNSYSKNKKKKIIITWIHECVSMNVFARRTYFMPGHIHVSSIFSTMIFSSSWSSSLEFRISAKNDDGER